MVRELFSKKMKTDFADRDIESAGRVGVKGETARDIVVKFANLKGCLFELLKISKFAVYSPPVIPG